MDPGAANPARRRVLLALWLPLVAPGLVSCRAGRAGSSGSAGPVPSASTGAASADGLLEAAAAVLRRRSQAVTEADPSSAARLWGQARPDLLARLRVLPVVAWQYRSSGEPLRSGGLTQLRVDLTYRLADDTADTRRGRLTTWSLVSGEWRMIADEAADPPGSPVDLWDLGPVAVTTSGRAVVIAAPAGSAVPGGEVASGDPESGGPGSPSPTLSPPTGSEPGRSSSGGSSSGGSSSGGSSSGGSSSGGPAIDAGAIAAQVAAAADRVARVWGAGDGGFASRRVVVLLPGSQQQAGVLLGRDAPTLDATAAETTGPLDRGPDASPGRQADRVVLNPRAYDRLSALGRRVVLTHELTHVLTRGVARSAVPLWLEEGIADWVAYSGSGLRPEQVAADALAPVRSGGPPAALPTPDAFNGADAPVAYAQAWVACDLLAGPPAPARSASAGPGSVAAGTAGAAEARAARLVRVYGVAAGVVPGAAGTPGPARSPGSSGAGVATDDARWAAAVRVAGFAGPAQFVAAWRARLVALAGPQ